MATQSVLLNNLQTPSQTPPAPSMPTLDERRKKNWKYVGYRGASQWMASDNDFFVVRRFATLNTRMLLTKQAQIYELDRQLDKVERPWHDIHSVQPDDVDNSTVVDDTRSERMRILGDLWKELKEYNEFLVTYSELKSRPQAAKFELQNVRQWLDYNKGAICTPEVDLFEAVEDLIPVTVRSKTPLRRFLERCGKFPTLWPFRRYLQSPFEDRESVGTGYFSDSLMDKFVYSTIVFLGLTLLLVPLWGLYLVSSLELRLGIITAFIPVFTILLTWSTSTNAFEAMAATAGYSAVLMVFMQINNNSK